MQAKRSLVTKIHKFLITEAGYARSEVQKMDQHDVLHNFVHSYCNIQMHSLDRKGMLTEVLVTPTNLSHTSTNEKPSDRWARLAGL